MRLYVVKDRMRRRQHLNQSTCLLIRRLRIYKTSYHTNSLGAKRVSLRINHDLQSYVRKSYPGGGLVADLWVGPRTSFDQIYHQTDSAWDPLV